ncbi:glycosyltransferase family A protein [Geminocystis sp. GBBB08]|uniref:glycosyltransferase family 2 protein n=1 Tax=Geminocystis sp. GBBB08 TaxID=2604140 RepID=UPI0027E38260|nr:glycosyltransferase family A protein [Geminocystis sp. GBBB08]MBL1211080.1 glycosyltransferase family 2 protein [Geminocystis sp. GBBB08]
MANKPLVSVIIPVYNGEKYLGEAIASVFKQIYDPLELIIVDDGSTDNSGNIAKSFPQILYIYQHNQGVCVARNRGIAMAKGEFIAFLDADDIWTNNKLETQINYFIKEPNIGYSITKQRFFFDSEVIIPSWFNQKFLSIDHNGYLASTLVVKREIFEKIGLFNTQCIYGGEATEWFFRAKDAKISMVAIPETLLLKRITNEPKKYTPNTKEIFKIIKASLERNRNFING